MCKQIVEKYSFYPGDIKETRMISSRIDDNLIRSETLCRMKNVTDVNALITIPCFQFNPHFLLLKFVILCLSKKQLKVTQK
jgi:hypothetical protein